MIFTLSYHSPVLLPEVIDLLQVGVGKNYIDGTVGGGGYAIEMVKRKANVLGIDADPDAIGFLKKQVDASLSPEDRKRITIYQGNFAHLKQIAEENGFNSVDGVLFDLGMSTHQLEKSGRGFSYTRTEPLDMRMDPSLTVTAADIINKNNQERLYEIFSRYSEELNSRPIAEAIVRARTVKGRLETTADLNSVIENTLKRLNADLPDYRHQMLYRDTISRIYQSLRITVNNELEVLKQGVEQSLDILIKGGRLAVLSYHSLEDRIVKQQFKHAEINKIYSVLTKNPIRPSYQEIRKNPKARSAKLRIIQKIT